MAHKLRRMKNTQLLSLIKKKIETFRNLIAVSAKGRPTVTNCLSHKFKSCKSCVIAAQKRRKSISHSGSWLQYRPSDIL